MIKNISITYNNDIEVSEELESLIEHIKIQYKVDIQILDYRQIIEEMS